MTQSRLLSPVVLPRSQRLVRTIRRSMGAFIAHAFLLPIGVFLLIPFAWMVSTSLKEKGREFVWPPQFIPDPIVWANYPSALTYMPFHLFFRNTLIITVLATIGTLLTASLAGYSFARLRFPLRDFWFMVLLSTLMLPYIVTLIPTFILFTALGWVDTFLPLIVPYWFGGSPFYVFLFRQFFLTIPYELEEAARVDGASYLRIWWQIMLPLSGPVIATVTIFSFIHHWNDFFGPLIYLNSLENRTLSIGLRGFQSLYQSEWNLLMAASTVVIAPVIVLFFAAQRYFMRGIVTTGFGGR